MLAAIDRIQRNTADKSEQTLRDDEIFFYGIVKNIEIIGEAAYKLSLAFKDRHPDTPWRSIVRMRHVLVHGYYTVDESETWQVIESDLAPLREQIARYLAETNWEEWESRPFDAAE